MIGWTTRNRKKTLQYSHRVWRIVLRRTHLRSVQYVIMYSVHNPIQILIRITCEQNLLGDPLAARTSYVSLWEVVLPEVAALRFSMYQFVTITSRGKAVLETLLFLLAQSDLPKHICVQYCGWSASPAGLLHAMRWRGGSPTVQGF